MILLLFTFSSSSRKFISSISRSRSRKQRTTPETRLSTARHQTVLVGAFTTMTWIIFYVLCVKLIIVLPVRWVSLISIEKYRDKFKKPNNGNVCTMDVKILLLIDVWNWYAISTNSTILKFHVLFPILKIYV